MVRASDLRLSGRDFDPRPPHYRSVGTGMGGRTTSVCNQPPGPTQPPTPCGREMSTAKSAVMSCGWERKAGWLIPFVDKRVGGR